MKRKLTPTQANLLNHFQTGAEFKYPKYGKKGAWIKGTAPDFKFNINSLSKLQDLDLIDSEVVEDGTIYRKKQNFVIVSGSLAGSYPGANITIPDEKISWPEHGVPVTFQFDPKKVIGHAKQLEGGMYEAELENPMFEAIMRDIGNWGIGGRVTSTDPNDEKIITGFQITQVGLTMPTFTEVMDGGVLRPMAPSEYGSPLPANTDEGAITIEGGDKVKAKIQRKGMYNWPGILGVIFTLLFLGGIAWFFRWGWLLLFK
jgi:hypothetical protein